MTTLAIIALFLVALGLWQALAGWRKLGRARANPDAPDAPLLARLGRIQLGLGAAMVVGNLLFNLPALTTLLGSRP